MTGTIHAAAASVPGSCTSGHGVLTPSQWTTCAKLGWSQSTTGAANAGATTGHYLAPVLAILAILALLALVFGRRSPAPQRS